MRKFEDRSPQVRGQLSMWHLSETGLLLPIAKRRNQIQFDWGFIVAQLMKGRSEYRINAMYIEFENVADPEDPVTVPTYGADEGAEYYDDLQSSGTRDFLRIPFASDPLLGIVTGAAYENYFTAGTSGNKLSFYAVTQGTEGVHGKTFSNGANSKVYGAALVATPVFADRTQDRIFARAYWDADEQAIKEPSGQLATGWDISLLGE